MSRLFLIPVVFVILLFTGMSLEIVEDLREEFRSSLMGIGWKVSGGALLMASVTVVIAAIVFGCALIVGIE